MHASRMIVLLSALITLGRTDAPFAPDGVPPVDGLIGQYYEAKGGYAHIKAIRSLRMRGTYQEGSFRDEHAMVIKRRTALFRVGSPPPDTLYLEGFDGASWEFYTDPELVLRTEGIPADATRRAAEFDDSLVDYREKGHRVEVLPKEVFQERAVWPVRVTFSDGDEKQYLLDVETHLVAGTRKAMPIHARGVAVRIASIWSDWQAVDGVLFPFASRDVNLDTGETLNELKWRSVEANVPLGDAEFAPPPVKRTPRGDLLADLYASRHDAARVEPIYRAFRRTGSHASLDLEGDLSFIGRQMVKNGGAKAAVVVLQINVGEHPSSSKALTRLGEAYAAVGDRDRAGESFRRALALDPKNEAAAQGLKELR